MLNSISWQEFLSTVALLLGCYYAITTLLLYSREIKDMLTKGKSIDFPHTKAEQVDSSESPLMGSVRYETQQKETPRQQTIDSDELEMAPLQEAEETIAIVDLQEESLKKDLVNIQTEISSLAEIIPLGTRDEAISLFKTLLSNYPQFTGTPFQPPISQFIYECCMETNTHQFDLPDINAWWKDSHSDAVNHP